MIGTQISHYVIESELGRGGMGVVYKARDTTLDRTVALKFLPPMFGADEEAEARFINEARAVSQLDHPNIAVVHEIDRTEEGQLFIVMACYGGRTLEARIADGPLPIEEVADIALQIASGLTRAHATGIIHRDIKPGNVMITEHGDVKILDFGLAKIQNQALTIGAKSLGTLAYMSPEQAQGREVDARTDLWALGVVMYEMLAGKRPFEGPYDAAILYSVANEEPEKLGTWRPETPSYLQELIRMLLEKDPRKRVQDAAEVLATLKEQTILRATQVRALPEELAAAEAAILDRESVASVAPRDEARALLRKPWVWVTALSMVWGLVFVILFALPGSSDSDGARRETARTHVETGFQHQQAREFSLAEAEYQRAVEADPELWSAWTSWASLKNELGEHEAAIDYALRAISLNGNDAVAYFNLGIAYEDSGQREEAYSAFADAVRIDALFTVAYSAWGNTLVRDGRYQEAVDVLERGRVQSPDDPRVYLIYRNLGLAYAGLERTDDAILYFESSLRIQPSQPTVIAELAGQYEESGDTAAALEQWTRYLDVETDPLRRRDAQEAIERLSELRGRAPDA